MNFASPITNPTLFATVTILLLVSGSVFLGGQSPQLGDGTATVEVVSPTDKRLEFEPGRFGTAADYLRLPDLVAKVTSRTGTPRIHYRIIVPVISVERQKTRLVRRLGRYRVPLADMAFAPGDDGPEPGVYTGRMVVRVQSFSTDTIVMNRSVRVRVPE